ncbi:MAG: ABC transporter ATP-binding protein [Tagaea sp. CACIAM 22H2]|jgi:putative ABC transport system ATP-binding protein|nr:ABC transporter ATP-binding protein [Tagaea sp. CACIAM 22H2]
MSFAVKCRDVIKSFESEAGLQRVLHGVDLDVPWGEMTMLVGPSGCGKTTLLSIVAGILSFDSGDVEVDGQDIAKMSDALRVAFRRRTLGFIFQQYNLLPALTAAENAAIPLVAGGMELSAAAKAAMPLLDQLGMGEHAAKLPRQLSGGQQQRVAIARALVHEPKLVVCDEPTAALDATGGRTVMEMLRAASVRADRATLVVTHDHRIFDFADRIVRMEDGRIAGIETKALETVP